MMKTKNNYFKIVSSKYLGEYKIKFKFNDKKEKIVDFYPFLAHSLNPHVRKYLDLTLFKKFSIQKGDLIWNDFDLCFPIMDLYRGVLLKEEYPKVKRTA